MGRLKGNAMNLSQLWRALTVVAFLPIGLQTFAEAPAAKTSGFELQYQYKGPNQVDLGRKYVHTATGTAVHIIRLETVPQAYVWVQSAIEAGRGEPHVCEHLLLSKGSKGKAFSLLSGMVLGDSSASTYNQFTNYTLYSAAGMAAFEKLLDSQLESLMRPDFTTTAVRREAYQFAVQADDSGKLSLVEKGTIYNEMLDSEDQYAWWYGINGLIFGKDHSLAQVSGGHPPEIRKLRGTHMWDFHQRRYRMGPGLQMIVVVPPNESESDFLARLNIKFNGLDKGREHQRSKGPLPIIAKPDPDKSVRIYPRPSADASEVSTAMMAWPPRQRFSVEEDLRLLLFMDGFASGSSSVLYKTLIKKETRAWDTGVGKISAGQSLTELQFTPHIVVDDLLPAYVTAENLERIREHVQQRLREFIALPDGHPEIKEFNEIALAAISSMERETNSTLLSPPGFGERRGGSWWKDRLSESATRAGTAKDLTITREASQLRRELASGANIWKRVVVSNGMLDKPYLTASIPSPEKFEKLKKEAEQRRAAKLKELMRKYNTNDPQIALQKFKEEYDRVTAKVEANEKNVPIPEFVENPPLGADPDLKLTEKSLGGVPILTSAFKSMPNTSFGVYFEVDRLRPSELMYLGILPSFITAVGSSKDGVRTSHTDIEKLVQTKMRSINVGYLNLRGKVILLGISGSGTNAQELGNAMDLTFDLVHNSDLSLANLSRLRAVVDHALQGLKGSMRGPEESWVDNSPVAFRYRENSIFLHTESTLVKIHDLHRLKWRLAGGLYDSHSVEKAQEFLGALRAKDYKAALALAGTPLVDELIKDLETRRIEVAPNRWNQAAAELTELYLSELNYGVERTLSEIGALRSRFLAKAGARGYLASDVQGQDQSVAKLQQILEALPTVPSANIPKWVESSNDVVAENLLARGVSLPSVAPYYVGLVHELSRNGNLIIASKRDIDLVSATDEDLMTVLGVKYLGGSGGHGFFMQTWEQGLAYSNGASASLLTGNIHYYAERAPSIRDTMAFVKKIADGIDTVEIDNPRGYVLSNTFVSRLKESPASRVYSQATDIWSGFGPEVQRRIYTRVMDLSRQPDFLKRIREGGRRGYSTIFANWGDPSMKVKMNSHFFFVAPEAQLVDMEKELGGPKLIRLYPSDFWDRR